MFLKRFRANNVRDALRAVRQDLGPHALVLSTEMVPAYGNEGHNFVSGRPNVSVWAPNVDAFFKKIGLQEHLQ